MDFTGKCVVALLLFLAFGFGVDLVDHWIEHGQPTFDPLAKMILSLVLAYTVVSKRGISER